MKQRLYLLKIQLLDIEPAIWRRFVVPSTTTLDRLHDVIQIVMGWTDSHLHEFTIGNKRYTEYPEFENDGLISGQYQLRDLVKRKGQTFSYLYDFGDSWEHKVTLEQSNYIIPEYEQTCVCIEGQRACPPEDVGGVPGYSQFSEALLDPNHEEYERFNEWSDGNYQFEQFDLASINGELMKFVRWARDRHQNCGIF